MNFVQHATIQPVYELAYHSTKHADNGHRPKEDGQAGLALFLATVAVL